MANDGAAKPEDERDFLVEVGRRVRQCRRSVSLTRKQLSERSGLSERYLAQLEAGEGNISILLIRRVARVLRVDLPRLVAEPAEQLSSRPTRIALLAERSDSGIDTVRRVGATLAARLSVPYLEIEQEVRSDLGEDTPDARERFGADYCRDVERKALLRITASHRRCVLGVGHLPVAGGELFQMLHERCVTLWLSHAESERCEFAQADHWVTLGDASPDGGLEGFLQRVQPSFSTDPHYRTRLTDRAGQWPGPAN